MDARYPRRSDNCHNSLPVFPRGRTTALKIAPQQESVGEEDCSARNAELLPHASLTHLRTVSVVYRSVLVAVECKLSTCPSSLVFAVPGHRIPSEGTGHYLGSGWVDALSHADNCVCGVHTDCPDAAVLHGGNSILSF